MNTLQAINTNFIKEWQPFDAKYKKVKQAIKTHFLNNVYHWQPTNNENSKRYFKPVSFSQIDNTLGLAYTSSGDYAGLWVCNGGYLWANDTHTFIGFAINELGEVVAICYDANENEMYIVL